MDIEHYPDSVAAQLYLSSIAAMDKDGDTAAPYVSGRGYYTNIYQPPQYRWQIVAVVGEEIPDESSGSGEIPDAPDAEYYSANWSAPPQSASGSFDYTYTINIDKSANITHEKLDDAIFQLTPKPSSGTIDGGTWTISDPQIVTTVDGAATATWTLHYSVSNDQHKQFERPGRPYASRRRPTPLQRPRKTMPLPNCKMKRKMQ